MFTKLVIVALASCIAGCASTNRVTLHYTAPVSEIKASPETPSVYLASFRDSRGEPPTWLCAIRGGFGNRLKDLELNRPVSELVHAAFTEALRARSIAMATAPNQNQLVGTIRMLDCDQYIRREANVDIELSVVGANGQQRYTRRYTSFVVDGSPFSFRAGIFASVEDLRALVEKTLKDVIDQALDDSALRAALQP